MVDMSESPAGDPAGDLGSRALFRLMAWLSPAFPVGAFSYSSGIEWAVEAGDIADAPSLQRWLEVVITEGGGFCDAAIFSNAHRAVSADDDPLLRRVAIARHCAAKGIAEPSDIEDRRHLHLEILYRLIADHTGETHERS
jgi:hypothetical protein